MFTFDLQLFGGGGPNNQEQSADKYYQQLANQSNQQFQEWNQYYLPLLKQYGPILQQAIMGQGPLMNAAEAPVNAATARSLNTMQNNIGGVINPDAAYADIALNGQQQAGLSADQMLIQAMTGMQNLLNTGQSGVGMGMSGLGNAGNGETNLGGQIWNQQNAWLNSLMNGLGEAGGMYASGGFKSPSSGSPGAGIKPQSISMTGPIPMETGSDYFSMIGQPGTSLTQSGGSMPVSGNPGSWLPPGNSNG